MRYTNTYNGNGKNLSYLTEKWDTTQQVWVNSQRTSTTYNLEDKPLSFIEEKWNGTSWIIQAATYSEYDANGLLTLKYSSTAKYFYTYNAQNQLVEVLVQYFVAGNWKNDNLTEYTYFPNGLTESVTTSHWVNAAWEKYSRSSNTYDVNGNKINLLEERWNGTAFENSLLYLMDYNASGDLVQKLTQEWDTIAWANHFKEETTFDANHNPTYLTSQRWIGGVWENDSRQFNEFDANSNWLIGRLEDWENSTWVLFAYTRKKYAEFVATYSAGISSFDIFPNPASAVVVIRGEGLRQAMLFDQQGRIVRAQLLNEQDQETLQLGNLPEGSYFLQVLDNAGKTGIKPLQIRR